MWMLVWSLLGANSPTEHRSMSTAEKEYIVGSLCDTTSKKVNPRGQKIAATTDSRR